MYLVLTDCLILTNCLTFLTNIRPHCQTVAKIEIMVKLVPTVYNKVDIDITHFRHIQFDYPHTIRDPSQY